ncbi:hypothetical protein [Runella sp.]|uniref:hypothetical protein n=1 Tax=Runella sp. TaxID=1960881 RepID=UPI003D0C6C03
MIKALRFLAVLLLLFNGIGALYGGGSLMSDPTGQKIQLPLSYLQYSPFTDYFIPGIVLFIANGVLSMIVTGLVLIRHRHYAQFVVLQGAILCGWIVIQVLMVRNIYYLHYIMGFIGIALIGSGIILTLKDSPTKKRRSNLR